MTSAVLQGRMVWLGVWCFTSLCVLPLSAQTPSRRSARDVYVRIGADKATYRPGEPIKVRLTLRNVSAEAVRFGVDVPREYVNLRVTDSDGRELVKDKKLFRQLSTSSKGRERTLKGGGELVLKWEDNEWMSLQDWGYRISKPGRYTITGAPYVHGDKLALDKSTRSNEVTITVLGK